MPRQTGYSRWITISGLLALIFILASCQSSCGNINKPKPKPKLLTAPQLLKQAQDAIQQVKSYHFTLSSTHLGTASDNSIQITKAEGDILVPDKLQAKASANAMGFAITTQLIAIGNRQYYTDPLTGLWTETNHLLNPRILTNRRTGIAGILGHIEHPTTPTNGHVENTPCWLINGTLGARYLSVITIQPTQARQIIHITVCIGKSDNLPYQLRMQGVAVRGDTSQTVRTFLLSHFNEPLNIREPQVA
jgi:hypothetical protein